MYNFEIKINNSYTEYIKKASNNECLSPLLGLYHLLNDDIQIIDAIYKHIKLHGLKFIYPEIILSFRNVMIPPELIYKTNEEGKNCLHLLLESPVYTSIENDHDKYLWMITLDKQKIDIQDKNGLYPFDYAILYNFNDKVLHGMLYKGYTFNRKLIKDLIKNVETVFKKYNIYYTDFMIMSYKKNNYKLCKFLKELDKRVNLMVNELSFNNDINNIIKEYL